MGTTVNIEDFRLARECAGGDERAMKELYSRYASGLYGLCIRYVGDRELARDLMHDSFIKIYETIGKYKPTGSLKSWMARVTVNLVIDHMRRARRLEKVAIEPMAEKIPDEPSQEDMKMVGTLPETKRVVFNLFCVEGYSHKDIAAMLGIKEKTSSSLLFKAREQLAQSVREYIRRNGL